ncbi:MAG: hypothetical protein LBB62_05150 [Proteiniphilum sp.]|jgi:hypothetical protein|nr:hypothetical protein [Proteiniphilum sp.]
MKKIVEEWKPVEGLPGNHTVSNMGRCMNNISKVFLKVYSHKFKRGNGTCERYTYVFRKNRAVSQISVGKLVAMHFIPNPNGYRHIRYKDGNPGNFSYLNIEWAPVAGRPRSFKSNSPEGGGLATERIENDIQFLKEEIEYLKSNRVAEFVYDKVMPIVRKCIDISFLTGREPDDIKEEFASYMADLIIDKLNRGWYTGFYSLPRFTLKNYKAFLRQLSGGIKTVELEESINYTNEAI